MNKIPFLDLSIQYERLKNELNSDFHRVMESGQFILSDEVDQFEKSFAKYNDREFCVSVASGTDALIVALKALDLKAGDEVILPTHTYIATALAVLEAGAKPVLVDSDSDTMLMNVNSFKSAINKKTKVVIPVHLYGSSCEMDEIMNIARLNNIIVLEDACQAHGAEYRGSKVGSQADISAFSFYPGKNLGAYGDGGAIVLDNPKLLQKIKRMRNYGQSQKYHHDSLGMNSRLDEIQAAFLRTKLKKLDKWNDERRSAAEFYKEKLPNIKFQKIPKYINSSYHLLVASVYKRDELRRYLSDQNVTTLIHYPIPVHMQKAVDFLGYSEGDFPNSERLANTLISLPLYPGITSEQISTVVEHIETFYE